MSAALHAEWTKIRTVAGPWWLVIGTVAATVALGAAATSVVTCGAAGCGDPVKLSLSGVMLGQALVAVLAVLMIGGEHGTGMIRATLTAVPHRATAYAAKAVLLTAVVAAAATAAVLGSLLAGRLVLARDGLPDTFPAGGPILRASTGSVLYLTLIALLSFGVAAVFRDSAISVGVVLGLLYLFPILAQVVGDAQVQRLLQRIGPMSAGLAVQATTDLGSLPLSPWAGLGVTAGWAAAALLTGGVLLRLRDA